MVYTVAGIENVNYTSKKSNKQVTGFILHLQSALPDSKGLGVRCENQYASTELAKDIALGDIVELLYNRYGTLEEIRIV